MRTASWFGVALTAVALVGFGMSGAALAHEAARKQKESPALQFLLGYHYAYLGYPKDAVRELDKAVALNPKDDLAAQLQKMMAGKSDPAAAAPADLRAPAN